MKVKEFFVSIFRKLWALLRPGIDTFVVTNFDKAYRIAKDLYLTQSFANSKEYFDALWLALRSEFGPSAPGYWLTSLAALVCDALKRRGSLNFD